ncbi:MAG: serine hydrolase domain-containing protein, partial [Halobacteria archaeon]|nr:serine hydrolase domain-containing protein [Halobacteria archaeon]
MSVFDADGKTKIRQLFDNHLEAGLQHGAQLAVYKDGEQVVDFAGGVTGSDDADDDEVQDTTTDTKHVLFSTTKPYAGVCLHQLVEDGEASYDDQVVEYWNAFDRGDDRKADVTVRHVLSHQVGMPIGTADADPDSWSDWDSVVEMTEEDSLHFEPGEKPAYHALTYGWLVGELVRRISGTPIDKYARENVFEPLGMDDTYIGLPDSIPADEVATLTGYEEFDRCRTPDVGLGTLDNREAAELFNREDVRRSVVPAATGIGTASDMAKFYACLVNGGELDGERILQEGTVDEATAVEAETEEDYTLGVPRRYALGFERGGTPWDKYGVLTPS